ncbi:hypothetical protein EGR_04163 [Echinococcus granulosus]|uniref:Uncharacterized protein n=1 Tax=Echinococcus granulosus TaxID=6210 RepID=W6URG3_ECHGR|nr:hypothetical protein EGR_04163 [Echinococcus granulosus]EUB60917.1 hypothetical protein EGR_04163 [Echinococcus granulosus]
MALFGSIRIGELTKTIFLCCRNPEHSSEVEKFTSAQPSAMARGIQCTRKKLRRTKVPNFPLLALIWPEIYKVKVK